MVRRGELQEQDVHQEGGTAHLLAQRLGADQKCCGQVPERNMRRDVDLLRGMTHRPPHHLVHQGIDVVDQAERPQPGRDQDDRARGDGEHRDDGGGERAEGHQRNRALIGLFFLGDHKRREEDRAADQRADREQDQAEIEVRLGLHRRIGGEHHAGIALEHGDIGRDRADDHHHEADPGELWRRQPRIEQDRGREIEHGDFEEDDPEQQHIGAVPGQDQIEPVGRKQMHRRPARQRDQQAHQPADGEKHHRGHGICLDQRLRRGIDLEAGILTGAELCLRRDGTDDGFCGHEPTSPRRGVVRPRPASVP